MLALQPGILHFQLRASLDKLCLEGYQHVAEAQHGNEGGPQLRFWKRVRVQGGQGRGYGRRIHAVIES